MKLNKAQRHKYYKHALSVIDYGNLYLCYLLQDVVRRDLKKKVGTNNIPKLFPEFKARRPKDYSLYIGWWAIGDIESRKKVLRACIRETAPKKRKKVSNQTKSKQ